MLEQRLAKPLHHAAVYLTLEQQRIDHRAEVVDDGVALDRNYAACRIDLDFDDVTAVREGRGARRLHLRGVEPGVDSRRKLGGNARGLRPGEQIDAPGGAGAAK